MSDWLIAPHEPEDVVAVAALVNNAYRGGGARAGWTHEADYIDGQRTSAEDLAAELAGDPAPVLLVLRASAGDEILACAMVERMADPDGVQVGYIGMLTVSPERQSDGLGRHMLAAAEARARADGAQRARMTVVSLRDSLIAWYRRRGYDATGERRAFPYADARFGTPRRDDLEFVVLEKALIDRA